ncbi:MAG: PEGA domain-containing protein [bacterium]|nr:PEGA domain-containing protein [bacterium]
MRGYTGLALGLLTVTLSNAITLTVETEPTGLDVWKNGEYSGTAPVVLEGPFPILTEITITGDGYEEVSEEVEINVEDEDMAILISPEKTDVLIIETDPPGLRVFLLTASIGSWSIKDILIGTAPVTLTGPFYEDFRIRIKNDVYEEVIEDVKVGWEGYEKKIVIAPEKKKDGWLYR